MLQSLVGLNCSNNSSTLMCKSRSNAEENAFDCCFSRLSDAQVKSERSSESDWISAGAKQQAVHHWTACCHSWAGGRILGLPVPTAEGHPMPQSIPAGVTREHVLRALADLDAGAAHPSANRPLHGLLYNGKRFALKAVVGFGAQSGRFCGLNVGKDSKICEG